MPVPGDLPDRDLRGGDPHEGEAPAVRSGATAMAGPPARRRRRLLATLAGALVLVVLAVTGAGFGALHWAEGRLGRVDAFAGLTDRPGRVSGAVTYLLVGSDDRSALSRADQRRLRVGSTAVAEGRRSDVMILAHVSRDRDEMTLVGLPRDLYVTVPAHTDGRGRAVPSRPGKLNSAYSAGGPALAVDAVEELTRVRVDHYVEVDFGGFEQVVDALDGVEVCTPRPLKDPKSGLDLPAGSSHVDGEDALAYVRARYVDGRGDLGRMERQQRFVGAVVSKAVSGGTLLNPLRLHGFLGAALGSVRTDPELRRAELLSLADRLRTLSPGDVRFLTVPVADPDYRPGGLGSTVLWDEAAARATFARMRADRPPDATRPRAPRSRPTVPPARVRVRVLNGAGVPGLARRAARDLGAADFDVVGPAANAATSGSPVTRVRYDSGYTESVKTLAAALPGARLEAVRGLGRTFEVVLGATYDGLDPVRLATAPPRRAGAGEAPVTRTAATDPCS